MMGAKKSVRFSAKVIGVNAALRPDGSVAVALSLGMPVVLAKGAKGQEEQKNTLHIELPGQQKMPSHENRMVLFFTEQEWESLEYKPTYGEIFSFESIKNGFRIVKESK